MKLFRFLLVVALTIETTTVAAEEKAEATLNPYLNFRANDSGQTADVGVEYYPTAGTTPGVRATVVVNKADPDEPMADVSNEHANLGLRLVPVLEFGPGRRDGGRQLTELSRFGVGLDAQLTAGKYAYNPGGGTAENAWRFSWKAKFNAWWFRSIGACVKVPSLAPAEVKGNAPVPFDCAQKLIQPQLRVTYDRTWKEADEVGVLQPADPDGVQVTKDMRIEAPSIQPKADILLAVAFEPGKGRVAYAPAVRFGTSGNAGKASPFGALGRFRAEFWVYYFAFEDSSAARVGLTPFIDIRTGGTDDRNDLVAGAVLELRSSFARLEY